MRWHKPEMICDGEMIPMTDHDKTHRFLVEEFGLRSVSTGPDEVLVTDNRGAGVNDYVSQ